MSCRSRRGSRALFVIFVVAFGLMTLLSAQQIKTEDAQKRFQQLYAAGNYMAALTEAEQAETVAKRRGTNNFEYVSALNDLARAHQALAHYDKAADLFKQVLGVFQKNAPGSRNVAQAMANLATVYMRQTRYGEAETTYKQALDIATNLQGPRDAGLATLTRELVANVADAYRFEGRFDEAEAQYKRALGMAEEIAGPNSLEVARILNNLTEVYENQSRFAEVDAAARRSLAIREQALGPNHPDVADSLNNWAHVDERLGRYAEADKLYRRAIEIWEKALGPKHPLVATALHNLASVYQGEERFDEAEALYKRALAIRKEVFGPNHLVYATTLNNLAQTYEAQGRYADVEARSKEALAVVEKALGPDNPDTAKVLRKLGAAFDGQGRYGEAEKQFKRALDIYTKAFGPKHRFAATVLINQGHLFEHQHRYGDAEQAYKQALAINEAARGANHPEVARVLNDLALLSIARGDPATAVVYSRKATEAILAHAAADSSAGRLTSEANDLSARREQLFANHVASLAAAGRTGADPGWALGREAFESAQRASQSSAAAAVQQFSLRMAANNDALAALVRENQDLSVAWRARDKALVEALSKPEAQSNGAQIGGVRKSIDEIERKLAAAAARLEKEFPEYAVLSDPKPVKVEDLQKLLAADEAFVFYLTGDKESYLFAATTIGFEWRTIPMGAKELSDKVTSFRRGLDIDELIGGTGKRVLFDLGLAHELYAALIGPVEALVQDKHHLIIVPTGALTSLPFHLLVQEQPASSTPAQNVVAFSRYNDAAWLLKSHAVSVVPSAASLKALRTYGRSGQATLPMVGFGDPVFDPAERERAIEDQTRRGGAKKANTRGYGEFWRSGGVDRAALRKLPSLLDSAKEIEEVAASLGASAADIHLARDATVTAVKRTALQKYHVVYFATHGLISGQFGLGEPALVLTLPNEPTDFDNGLLTASEVAQLKLDADWVVLSACNTAAGDKPGAEGLSGLARAFFYSGARALLVSHWSTLSGATERLMTSTFEIMKRDPKIGRAEALRQAMLASMNDKSDPLGAYPALWGAFSIIGEGAAR